MDIMTTTTMENRCLTIAKMALIIDRLLLRSTEKVINCKIATLRTNQLRRHTKNMRLQQRFQANQINTRSLGAFMATQTEEQETMELLLISSKKGKYFFKLLCSH